MTLVIEKTDVDVLRRAFQQTWSGIASNALAAMEEDENDVTNVDVIEMCCDYLPIEAERIMSKLMKAHSFQTVIAELAKLIQLL